MPADHEPVARQGSRRTHDLGAVDDLCRLAVVARRLGCRIHLADVDPDLERLLEFAGVRETLGTCPAGELR